MVKMAKKNIKVNFPLKTENPPFNYWNPPLDSTDLSNFVDRILFLEDTA